MYWRCAHSVQSISSFRHCMTSHIPRRRRNSSLQRASRVASIGVVHGGKSGLGQSSSASSHGVGLPGMAQSLQVAQESAAACTRDGISKAAHSMNPQRIIRPGIFIRRSSIPAPSSRLSYGISLGRIAADSIGSPSTPAIYLVPAVL